MNVQAKGNLKQRIAAEMTADYANALEKNFDLAKQFIRITKEGNVVVLVKDHVTGIQQIQLYLIGKLYAKEAGFVTSDDVTNSELLTELGLPKGSLLPWVKQLRDGHIIKQVKRGKYTNHVISANLVEKILNQIDTKLKKTK